MTYYQKKKLVRKAVTEDLPPMTPEEKVRKWERKWVNVANLRVLKWEAVTPKFKPTNYHKEILLQKKIQIAHLAGGTKTAQERKNMDNAPITRSLSAVYGGVSDDRMRDMPRRRSTRLSEKPHNDTSLIDQYSEDFSGSDSNDDENF